MLKWFVEFNVCNTTNKEKRKFRRIIAVKEGDSFKKNDWQDKRHLSGCTLKPNESWPKAQLAQIDKTIAELAALDKKSR